MRVAIIPARGGSKRIPRKNTKEFNGKPIILYSVENAVRSGLFDKVIISTDNKEVVNITKGFSVEIWERSNKNSDDYATISDVVCEVLEQTISKRLAVEEFALIYATAPLLDVQDLMKSHKLLDGCDAVLPVVEFSYPIQRSLRINACNELEFVWPEYINSRSQDLEKRYHDTGSFFWSKKDFFLRERNIFNGRLKPYLMNLSQVQDIDTEEDWKLCESKYRFIKNESII